MFKDQYGQDVPADLVVLHFGFAPEAVSPTIMGDPLELKIVNKIMAADWYEVWTLQGPTGLMLASAEAIEYESEIDLVDCGIDLTQPDVEIMRVADPLKRYTWKDGFYHA